MIENSRTHKNVLERAPRFEDNKKTCTFQFMLYQSYLRSVGQVSKEISWNASDMKHGTFFIQKRSAANAVPIRNGQKICCKRIHRELKCVIFQSGEPV